MPTTTGSITRVHDTWCITAAPHVMMRLRRVLTKCQYQHNKITVVDTPEVCRDLQWFSERYPLTVDAEHAAYFKKQAKLYEGRKQEFDWIASGKVKPRQFDMAVQPREYQRVAADLALRMKGLLIGDSVGLGKTATAIAMLTDPDTRPALVVTLTHLPGQWEREIKRFVPGLTTHIIKKGQPYNITAPRKARNGKQLDLFTSAIPDVLIINYHKLDGWRDVLAEFVRTTVFDEIQELRRTGTAKYDAAIHIAHASEYRAGLSVGPETCVELVGGPFGMGWSGEIEDAYNIVTRTVESEPIRGYDVVRVAALNIIGRGLAGDRFGWKHVRSFIRHACDRPVRTIHAGGRKLLVTDDHAVYRTDDGNFVAVRGDHIAEGDIVPADDGYMWQVANEQPVDMLSVASAVSWAQVVVDISGVSRTDLGLTAWQWQNFHKEASYGPRLPLDVFLKYRAILPEPTLVYVGRGKAPCTPPTILLSEWAYVLGFFIGDGWVEGRNRVAFSVDPPNVERLLAALHALPLGLRPKISKGPSLSVEVRCTHKLFAEVLEYVGVAKPCYDKTLPGAWLMSWPDAARRELLNGLLDSDGHRRTETRNRRCDRYTTTSKALATSVHSLLRSLGVLASICAVKPQVGGVVDGRQIVGKRTKYDVYWSRNALNGDNAGCRGARRALSWSRERFNEAPVRSNSQESTQPMYVYDLEMAGHPSFVANGLLVHNSATPIFNYGDEFFSVMDVLRPGELGSRYEFNREWCHGMDTSGKALIREPRAFGAYLRDHGMFLRRTREDVGRELPALSKVVHTVESDYKAIEAVGSAAVELAARLLDQDTDRFDRMRAGGELDWRMRMATGMAKSTFVADFVRMLVESGEKVVLFGWHRSVYDVWQEKLKDLGVVFYTGAESTTQKEAARLAFTEGGAKVLVMSLRSGAGLDGLQNVCHNVVFGELDWSPACHEQCTGRVFRDGQARGTMAYFLVSDEGSDPIVMEALGLKATQLDGVINPTDDAELPVAAPEHGVRQLAELILKKFRAQPPERPASAEQQ